MSLLTVPAVAAAGAGTAQQSATDCTDKGLPRRSTPIQGLTKGHRPIIYVHGWTSTPEMWTGDFDFAGKLESQLATDGKKTTQNFLFDYGRFSTTWASDPAIAACLGKYIHDVGEAYKKADPDSDGKVIAIGHSMGGLAILYSTSSEFASITSADYLAGTITLDTPYLGSYQGGFDPFSITNRVGTLMQFGKVLSNGYPPDRSNALYCLAIHHSGGSIPPPCTSKIPPELPAGTSLTQIAGSITIKRTLLGAFDYSLPLGNDGVVPVDSQLGYLKMRAKTPTGTGIKVRSEKVECSVTTGDLRQAAASSGVSTLASVLLSPLTLFSDYFTLSALGTSSNPTGQDTQRLNTTLVVNGLANLKADCSHSHIYHNQSALNKTTEAVKEYLSDLEKSGSSEDSDTTVNAADYKVAGGVYAFKHPSGTPCVIGDSTDLSSDVSANTLCLDEGASWLADPRPDASICPESMSWVKNIAALMKAGVSAGYCTGDNPTYPARKVLPLWKSITVGSATCRAVELGVICSDSNLGTQFQINGVFLNREGQQPYWVTKEQEDPLFHDTKLWCDAGYRLNYIVKLKSGGEAGRCAAGEHDDGYLLFYSPSYIGTGCDSYGSGPQFCLVNPTKLQHGDITVYAVDKQDPTKKLYINNQGITFELNGETSFSDDVVAHASKR